MNYKFPRQTLNIYTKHKHEIKTKKLAQNELHKGKLRLEITPR